MPTPLRHLLNVMIDSHCHLADETFAPDLAAVVTHARAAGVERVLVILEAGNAAEAAQAARLRNLWPETRVAIGVHPHHAHQFAGDASGAATAVYEQVQQTPDARAVGEIGLDYHYDYSPREVQQAVFRAQLGVARDSNLPVIIHTREADADTVDILTSSGGGNVRGVIHCFTGTQALAAAALNLGFYISFSGIVTFPRAEDLRDVARRVPLDRLLIETDSPFLAPVPYRGKRNEPAHVARVADTLAALHGISPEELSRTTTANFHTLFRP